MLQLWKMTLLLAIKVLYEKKAGVMGRNFNHVLKEKHK